jgi:hypothetical protein
MAVRPRIKWHVVSDRTAVHSDFVLTRAQDGNAHARRIYPTYLCNPCLKSTHGLSDNRILATHRRLSAVLYSLVNYSSALTSRSVQIARLHRSTLRHEMQAEWTRFQVGEAIEQDLYCMHCVHNLVRMSASSSATCSDRLAESAIAEAQVLLLRRA